MTPNDPNSAGRLPNDRVDELLALHLASGLSVKAAAKKAGTSESTAHRRLECPEFKAKVDGLRSQLVTVALVKLEGAMSEAADTLRSLLTNKDPHVKIRASSEILKNALRVKEVAEFTERLKRIETYLEEQRRCD
jgi:hypothetical protein